MRLTDYFLPTVKETPADAEVASHRLMLRAGLIRKLASGLYTWLPLGLRILRKVEHIVREEMNASGALEVLMPLVQPAELWRESGRWQQMGPELLRLQDRHQREFCLGPTHEEVITDVARRELLSYRQLPVNLYQIQLKFRDEVRPRFGILRAREFIMMDGYSFHDSQASFDQTYQKMYDCYSRILTRIGLNFRAVLADPGNIGGGNSHEFHVLAESGEDVIAFSDGGGYAANLERAEYDFSQATRGAPMEECRSIDTPGKNSIEELCDFLGLPPERTVKTLLVRGTSEPLVALVLRGDHELNELKAARLDAVAAPLQWAPEAEVEPLLGAPFGSIGPKDLGIPLYVDHSAALCSDFVCGANVGGCHLVGVNWGRDLDLPADCIQDIRNVQEGDPSPVGKGKLCFARGIEVGHIFQLGVKYSEALNARILDEEGRSRAPIMGCYGIGVTRMVGAIIEQNHDDKGICWPASVAPFQVLLTPLRYGESELVRKRTNWLYGALREAGVETLLDDRDERPGVKFADADLIGIPWRVVLSDRGLGAGQVELAARATGEVRRLAPDEVLQCL